MGLIAEVWTRPGDANFGRVIDGLPIAYQSLHVGMNQPGDGAFRVPNTFDRFDEILDIDDATPSSSVASLVRVYSTQDLTTPVGEWLPNQLLPTDDKFDLNVDIAGQGMNSVMAWARTEAYDWDGSDDWVPRFPDWIYGGDNILSNPGFENSVQTSTLYELLIDATGGTYTLTDGTDTTMNIAFNASESTVETRLETDIAAIDDVLVTPIDGGFEIEFVNPAFGITLSVNTGSLTGGSATSTRTFVGSFQPNPWTKSQQINVGTPREFGVYDNFRVVGPSTTPSGPVHSGSYSLWINPGTVTSNITQFAGAQQVVNVQPGGTYQASVWAYSVTGGDYRLVIRGLDEDLIAFVDVTLGAATWTEVSIADVFMETATGFQPSQVIFRFANVEPSGTPSDFYIDDGALKEGNAATTLGAIFGDLYDDATSNHSGRVVWEDLANPGTPWLTLDFTDSVDSAGDAWFEQEVSIRIWMRMTYLQVLDQFARQYGIEWRVVPDDVEAGTWELQMYNPGGMSTDYTAAQAPAIQGGSTDVRRSIRRFMPSATNHLVEGELRITSRRDSIGLEAAVGRIEGSRIDRQLPDTQAVADSAYEDSVDSTSNASPYVYELVNPQDEPMYDYVIGDVLTVHDPPEVNDAGRLIDVEVVDTPEATVFEVQFFPTTPAGS